MRAAIPLIRTMALALVALTLVACLNPLQTIIQRDVFDALNDPEIRVTGPDGARIVTPTGVVTFDGTLVGSRREVELTIGNAGTQELDLTGSPAVEILGDDAGLFSVSLAPLTRVAVSGSTRLRVSFAPTAAGAFEATVRIPNSDPDDNPYEFRIQAVATLTLEPDIVIERSDASSIPAGTGSYTFAVTTVGSTREAEFTIRNTGSADLLLTGSPTVQISGAGASRFAVSLQPQLTVPASGRTTFRLVFEPVDDVTATARVMIANNDPDESPFAFDLSAQGVIAPEMELLEGANPVPHGIGGYAFAGTTRVGATVPVVFTIRNDGSADLQLPLTPVTISGAQAEDFVVAVAPAATIAQGGSTDLTVEFAPKGPGTRTATVSIANNDWDRNPYNFTVTGSAYVGELRITCTGVESAMPTLVWTGTRYGLAWQEGNSGSQRISFSRISSGGYKETGGIAISSNTASVNASLAWTGSDFGLVWDRATDIWFAGLHDPWTETFGEAQLTTTESMSLCPSIAWTGTEYGVAWGDQRGGDTESEIYFAIVDAAGSRVGGETRLTNAAGWSLSPRVVWTGTNFGAVWLDTRGGSEEVYFARMSAGGAKLGGDVRITDDDSYPSSNPSLVWTGSEYGVAWFDARDGNEEIYFARISAAGGKPGSDVRITTDTAASRFPSLAWTGSDYGVAWEDSRNGNSEIYFARISAAGVKQGNDVLVTTDDAYDSAHPSLVASGSTYGLAWQDLRDEYPPGRYEIYFAILTADGDKR